MYELLSRSPERPWAIQPLALAGAPIGLEDKPVILHMRENRSPLSREARLGFSALGLVLMFTSIAPALKGYWLVPAFSMLAIAALTIALERHGKSRPASETLEFLTGRVRHHDSCGHCLELPSVWLRLIAEGRGPGELRLFLRGRDGSIEFGRCLGIDERRAIAPLVAAALARTRQGA